MDAYFTMLIIFVVAALAILCDFSRRCRNQGENFSLAPSAQHVVIVCTKEFLRELRKLPQVAWVWQNTMKTIVRKKGKQKKTKLNKFLQFSSKPITKHTREK